MKFPICKPDTLYFFTYPFPTSYPKSIMGNIIRAIFRANFNLFTTVHGTFLSGLLYVYHRENGYRISKMTNGTYTKTVCWKHVVKSGLSVYQVTSRSQIKSVQKLWVWLAMPVFDYVDNFCKLMKNFALLLKMMMIFGDCFIFSRTFTETADR